MSRIVQKRVGLQDSHIEGMEQSGLVWRLNLLTKGHATPGKESLEDYASIQRENHLAQLLGNQSDYDSSRPPASKQPR